MSKLKNGGAPCTSFRGLFVTVILFRSNPSKWIHIHLICSPQSCCPMELNPLLIPASFLIYKSLAKIILINHHHSTFLLTTKAFNSLSLNKQINTQYPQIHDSTSLFLGAYVVVFVNHLPPIHVSFCSFKSALGCWFCSAVVLESILSISAATVAGRRLVRQHDTRWLRR